MRRVGDYSEHQEQRGKDVIERAVGERDEGNVLSWVRVCERSRDPREGAASSSPRGSRLAGPLLCRNYEPKAKHEKLPA